LLPINHNSPLTPRSHLVFKITYDGTRYFGWQKTNEGPSIEEELEKAAGTILQTKVLLQAASRTDRGVHARGQVVDCLFQTPVPPLGRFFLSMNQLLPSDIRLMKLIQAPHEQFHATLSSLMKRYLYRIIIGPVLPPHLRLTHWHLPYSLDLSLMEKASSFFIGRQDFESVSNKRRGITYSSTERTLHTCSMHLKKHSDYQECIITLEGDHFLYKMARTIVGTLVWIGRGKLPLSCISNLFIEKDRTLAGMTAPCQGLELEEVMYKEKLWD
jgi:tRNA pseudouridine38-40 synthase